MRMLLFLLWAAGQTDKMILSFSSDLKFFINPKLGSTEFIYFPLFNSLRRMCLHISAVGFICIKVNSETICYQSREHLSTVWFLMTALYCGLLRHCWWEKCFLFYDMKLYDCWSASSDSVERKLSLIVADLTFTVDIFPFSVVAEEEIL